MAQLLKYLLELSGEGKSSASHSPGLGQDAALAAYIETISKLAAALERARLTGSQTYSELGRSAQTWSELSTKATRSALEALADHQKQLTESVTTHSRAEQAKSLATTAAVKHTAFYKAIAATAAGFQALGEFDFWSAAQDFTSAALWGTLAGTQLASASSPGGPRSRGSAGIGDGGSEEGSSEAGAMPSVMGAGAASAAGRPGGNLTVAIMGDNDAGEWLAKTLNTAVETRGVQLTSTRSTRSAYAQG